MDESNFESWQPWTGGDFARHTYALTASEKLWGNLENLQRQLAAPSPVIPEGLRISELRFLEKIALAAMQMGDRAPIPGLPKGKVVTAGGERWTVAEARCEIVRRAIQFLGEN